MAAAMIEEGERARARVKRAKVAIIILKVGGVGSSSAEELGNGV